MIRINSTQRTHTVSVTKKNHLMPLKEIPAICFENYIKGIYICLLYNYILYNIYIYIYIRNVGIFRSPVLLRQIHSGTYSTHCALKVRV